LGFQREQEFSEHVTLARVKKPTDLSRLLASRADFEPFSVKEISVFESKTTPSGAIYRELHRIPLA
jgi:2'-5' RNA ligase